MKVNETVKKVHENAVAHGWWEEERTLPELLALIHSEVSEALEEIRNGIEPTKTYYSGKISISDNEKVIMTSEVETSNINKPEGVPSELADIVIRVMDICGRYGIDLESSMEEKIAYNETRPYKHGGKKL